MRINEAFTQTYPRIDSFDQGPFGVPRATVMVYHGQVLTEHKPTCFTGLDVRERCPDLKKSSEKARKYSRCTAGLQWVLPGSSVRP